MKKILKNNSIIITALCIMIAIVWYLNYQGGKDEKVAKEDNIPNIEVVNDDTDYLDANKTLTENGLELSDLLDLENEAAITDDTTTDQLAVNEQDMETAENFEDLDLAEGMYEDEDMADISDEDIAQNAENTEDANVDVSSNNNVTVADNGEVVADDESNNTSTPGEAVLASTSINASFFSSAKLTREQNRAKEKEMLLNMIENENLSDEVKQEAINSMLALKNIMEKENSTEILLEAKGFDGAVVSIVDEVVDVVINAPTITEQQVAQIESIVKRKTGVGVENIVINPVVVVE